MMGLFDSSDPTGVIFDLDAKDVEVTEAWTTRAQFVFAI